jgi:autotransporter-associated beta strand protein
LVTGVINISPLGVLTYNYSNTVTLANSLAGGGTVNYDSANSGTLTLPLSGGVNSNYTGVANIESGVRVHAQNGSVFPFGNGSTVNVPPLSQAWCDGATTPYNNTFNIAGTGWPNVVAPLTPSGAISVYQATFTGAINLTANARISGTINGGTIMCPISGPYRLEIWGNWGSYVLSMTSSNGVHSYASTLLTSGSVRALNTNAISTGPLTLDYNGDLRLNGNNLTVANLSSVDNGHGFSATNYPTIQNTSTTNATLTVGTDNTSTTFDGVFTNGGTGTLGLTKVGTGTLTLSRASTNTGAITVNAGTLALSGSGSFKSAALIFIAGGADLDIASAGGTMTLNSGQKLKGNGTVSGGNLVSSSGSIVQPGDDIGTLNVSGGSVTLGGTLMIGLNRTNTPSNCDQLTASGGITYGGTLATTNEGPALQVTDFFQLFPGAVTTFAGFNLQTNDTMNNVTYVWNNTVASNGRITVSGVFSRATALSGTPTASAIVYGQAVSNSVISGSVTNMAGAAVPGTFTFTTPTNAPGAGTSSQSVTFTPANTNGFNSITFNINVTVNKQTPLLKTAPTASNITNGNTLSLSILTGGAVTNAAGVAVAGTLGSGGFAFTTPSATPGVGTAPQSVTFTPTDTADYNSITLNVSVTVVAAPSAVTALKFTGSPVVSGTSLTISGTNTGAGTFYLLSGTNLAAARTNWTPLWTNVAAGSSSFTTNLAGAVNPALGIQFYILSTTNNH